MPCLNGGSPPRTTTFCLPQLISRLWRRHYNYFQIRCFEAPLQPAEIASVKLAVQEKMPEGVNANGLTLAGFLYLRALFIENGQVQTTWTVLRKFDYDNDMKVRDDSITKIAPDQTLELTNEVVDFLRGIFNMFDMDNDRALLPAELENLFSER